MIASLRQNLGWVTPLLLFMLGLALRLYCLDCHSLWFDETASIEVAQRGLKALLTDRFGWMQVQTPLHYLIVWLTIQPVDPTSTAFLVRLPSALAGAFTVPLVYALGREVFGRTQGLIAALLVAVSAVHLNYSQDVRPYAILTLLTLLSAYCLVKADRTRSPRWWIAFGIATAADVAISYNVLTLVLPALAPYGLWAVWRLWLRRKHSRRTFFAGGLALFIAGLSCLLAVTDLLRVPRDAPDMSRIPVAGLFSSILELAKWFTQFGLGEGAERLLESIFVLLCLFGTYMAIKGARKNGAALCWLFMLVPAPVLTVLGTTNVVYQRYALFVLPFYFLLIGNGVWGLVLGAARLLSRVAHSPALSRAPSFALLAVVMLPFANGIYVRSTAYEKDEGLVYRPDLRGTAAYLSEHATSKDAIIFAGWDPTVSTFYWHGTSPAPSYSIMDPRLFTQHVQGTVYWVVSFDWPLSSSMAHDPRWVMVSHMERVSLYREVAPGANLGSEMEWFTHGLEGADLSDRRIEQTVDILRGGIYQAHDQPAQAAQAYYRANTLFPIGGEYLRTARGFVAHGDIDKAWRDGLIAKSMEPQRPDLHLWMADTLATMGMPDQSRVERQIAQELQLKVATHK